MKFPPVKLLNHKPRQDAVCFADAFSLIEVLVVIAIIGILATVAVPAFNSIGAARGVTDGAYQVRDAIELARSEAVTRNAFIWLGFEPRTNGGTSEIRLHMAQSTEQGGSVNNLRQIARPVTIQNVSLLEAGEMDVGDADLGSPTEVASVSPITLPTGSARTIAFTPAGEAMVASGPVADTNGFTPLIGIGMRQMRGAKPIEGNDVAVVIDGSVALPAILRK